MEAIDLGIKSPLASVAGQPGNGEAAVHYPSLYIDSDSPILDLPDEGTMTIAFKRGSKSMNESADGSQRHSVSIEVTQILDVEGGEAEGDQDGQESDDEERESQLDKYAAEEVSKKPAKAQEEAD